MKKVYISCPIVLSMNARAKIIEKASISGKEVSAWERGRPYSDKNLLEADEFILVTPNNAFKIDSQNDLPTGVKSELLKAYLHKKTIYLAYMNQDREYNFYNTSIPRNADNLRIEGIPGTTHIYNSTAQIEVSDIDMDYVSIPLEVLLF